MKGPSICALWDILATTKLLAIIISNFHTTDEAFCFKTHLRHTSKGITPLRGRTEAYFIIKLLVLVICYFNALTKGKFKQQVLVVYYEIEP